MERISKKLDRHNESQGAAGALIEIESAIAVYERAHSKSGADTILSRHAQSIYNKGFILLKQRKAAESLPFFEEALARLGESPSNAVLRSKSKRQVGIVFEYLDRKAEAEPYLLESYHLAVGAHVPNHPEIQDAVRVLRNFYRDWGRQDESDRWNREWEEARAAWAAR